MTSWCTRLERADEALQEAQILADSGHPNTCVNRLYYASFYAVSALLLTPGISSSKHAGIRSFFNRLYVKTGTVAREQDRTYNDLFERRQEADDADFVDFEEPEVRRWLASARTFVERMKSLVAETGD